MTGLSGGALDDATLLARTDRSGMIVQVAAIPGQARDAWARSRELELPGRHGQARSVAVLGVGGAAAWGDLVVGALGDRLRVPVEVVRGYELPGWAGAETLVVAATVGGDDEEVLGAAETAFARRCPVAVIAGGGPLATVAEKVSLPLLRLPAGVRARTAVGAGTILLAGLLERAGLVSLTADEVEAAAADAEAALVAWGPDVPTEANAAKQLAWALVDRLPIVIGSGALAPVARRWKTQLNENAKTAAVWDELPEASHNTVAGFPHPDVAIDHQLVVLLASDLDHPRTTLRAELAGELMGEAGIAFQTIHVAGASRLAVAFRGVVLGDLVSAYLAVLLGVDPTPVDAVARLQASLAATDAAEHEGASDPSGEDSEPL